MKMDVAASLEALQHEDGSLVAGEVVETARDPRSPLHGEFEWDDTTAAQKHRLHQARSLIRHYMVHVISETASGEKRDLLVRGFTAARSVGVSAPSGTYLPTAGLRPQERDLLLLRMRREIEAMRVRYGTLNEFWAAVAALSAQRAEEESGKTA